MKKTTIKQNLLILLFALGSVFSAHSQKTQTVETTAFGKKINSVNPDNGFIRCVTDEYEKSLQEQNPKRMSDAQFEAWLKPLVEDYKSGNATYSQSGGIITIPVVVHVIHNGQPVGTAPNITDAQVESQITVMNNDYRRMANTPGFNTNPIGADVMIQFALAKVDPNGNPTNGINRVNLCQPSWSTNAINSTVKPQTIWDADSYLNMWSVQFSNGNLLGYAQFPSASGLPGLNTNEGAANTDGVVCNFATFGSINYDDGTFLLSAPYNEGRTMTHEVGHWLGLRHIWGDGSGGCSVDDFCADTPNAAIEHYNCETGSDTCPSDPGLDMVENYMDYSNDACMNIFTLDQKARMTAVMNNSLRRVGLKTSTKDVAIPLFANDAEIKLEAICATAGGSCTTTPTRKVILYNRGTSVLTSASISSTVAGNAASTYNWTGSLAPNKFAIFDLPVVATANGNISVSVVNANGVTDQRVSNNTATGAFTMPVAPTNHVITTAVFRLQNDRYASETSWTLKNSAGAILYQSTQYANTGAGILPGLITQNWTLPANDCYTFTITDAYGDGICCTYGIGYYDIKTSTGTVIAASPASGSYGSGESKIFTNNSLGRGEFASSNDIYLYPNPANSVLNIAVTNNMELPESYTIYNSLGQEIQTVKVTSEANLSVNTSSYSNGVYLIKLFKDNGSKTLRFIKN